MMKLDVIKRNKFKIAIMLLIGAWAIHHFLFSKKPEQKNTYEFAVVEHGDIANSVTATGTIEPVTSVEVGTQVSGIVSKIYVDYNSVVKAGQVIAELDRTNLMSELSSQESNLKSMQSDLEYQRTHHERFKNLYDQGLISANEYEQAHLSYVKAQQAVAQQQQYVKRALTNLGYATITSPIDGVVLSKEVEEGQTVAASFNTPTLFKIAQDLTDMRVIAKVDEADIGEVREGQRVSFTVDAFPNDVFQGSVTQVRQEATTESNVVTYEVVIGAPNEDLKLKPGLTANIVIYTMEVPDVTIVPSRALRFQPTADKLNKGDKLQDCQAAHKVWVKEGNTIKAIPVEIGAMDATKTQITGGIAEGTEVMISITEPEPEAGMGGGSPFMPQRKNDKNGKKK